MHRLTDEAEAVSCALSSGRESAASTSARKDASCGAGNILAVV